MLKGDIKKSLKEHTHGAGTITCKQLSEWLGVSDQNKVKRKYLASLDSIGTHYLIDEVAQQLIDMRKPAGA